MFKPKFGVNCEERQFLRLTTVLELALVLGISVKHKSVFFFVFFISFHLINHGILTICQFFPTRQNMRKDKSSHKSMFREGWELNWKIRTVFVSVNCSIPNKLLHLPLPNTRSGNNFSFFPGQLEQGSQGADEKFREQKQKAGSRSRSQGEDVEAREQT